MTHVHPALSFDDLLKLTLILKDHHTHLNSSINIVYPTP